MKKIAAIAFGFLFAANISAQTFSDDFETYTVGTPLGPQSATWTTWSGIDGSTDDVNVVSTDNHTSAGSKSIYFSSTLANGGPQDCVLPFAGTPLTTGQFTFTAWFKVPTSKTAYFNFQGNATMGNQYAMDCFMNADGTIDFQNSGTSKLKTTYPTNAWFELKIDIKLNSNKWEVFIDGVSKGYFSAAINKVFAIDLYPANSSASFWVDDVTCTVVPYTLPNRNAAANLLTVTNGLVGQQRSVSVGVKNLGVTTITSFDLTVDNGGTPVVQNVTGVNIASLATSTVNITTPFTLVSGLNTFTAVVSNVNGTAADDDPSDDNIAVSFTPVLPAIGRKVVVEEATGTWCQWCPRGAVFMDLLNTKYPDHFVGVAVHNNDPMADSAYDAGIGNLIGGYPSVVVDRGTDVDPSAMEADFLARVQIAPKTLIKNVATFDPVTRVLNVSIINTLQQSISSNYKIACVLTEDGVKGTTSGYNQSNSYAGGAYGPMGGYESRPNPVPASTMVYDHVARVISPGFDGQANAFGTATAAGQVVTFTFTYTLPSTWNTDKMHVVGMVFDGSGKIDNTSSTTIAEAIANGVSVSNINMPDAQLNLYPNPAGNRADISLSLVQSSDVNIEIYDLRGSLISKKEYGKLSGKMILPVEMSNLSTGMYFLNVNIEGQTSVLKLIKQ